MRHDHVVHDNVDVFNVTMFVFSMVKLILLSMLTMFLLSMLTRFLLSMVTRHMLSTATMFMLSMVTMLTLINTDHRLLMNIRPPLDHRATASQDEHFWPRQQSFNRTQGLLWSCLVDSLHNAMGLSPFNTCNKENINGNNCLRVIYLRILL